MSKLKQFWKALGPALGIIGIAANTAGPQNMTANIVIAAIAFLTTVFGPANATA